MLHLWGQSPPPRSHLPDASSTPKALQWPASAGGAGLVPSKTSPQTCINLAPSAVADRRVQRLKRSVWASGHLHALADRGFRPPVCWFVTLTYAKAHAWRPHHVAKATERFYSWCRSKGVPCRYTWVAEIQPRRAERTGEHVVHYHLLAWLSRRASACRTGTSQPARSRDVNVERFGRTA